ncbi:MAG: PrgI family protein [Patescibacteria group bacterium]
MRFTVPQFIEVDSKIVGPLTFKQFGFFGIAGVIAFMVYFVAPFEIFMFSGAILIAGAAALAFLKIDGVDLPNFLVNAMKFNSSPKMYIWKKGEAKIEMVEKKIELVKSTKESPFKTSRDSQIKKLQTFVETKKN